MLLLLNQFTGAKEVIPNFSLRAAHVLHSFSTRISPQFYERTSSAERVLNVGNKSNNTYAVAHGKLRHVLYQNVEHESALHRILALSHQEVFIIHESLLYHLHLIFGFLLFHARHEGVE